MQKVRYYNRETKRMEEEAIYGEKWLRWAYETRLGRLTTRALIGRKWLSNLYGHRMNRSQSKPLIRKFIETYNLDPSEFLDPVDSFNSFNDFFARKLKPDARPIDSREDCIIFPADARHLYVENSSTFSAYAIKGESLDLTQILGMDLSKRYRDGPCLISRLCPTDYHRFHFPFSGSVTQAETVRGAYYSVNPIALLQWPRILLGNKRTLAELIADNGLRCAYVDVGATCVGSIVQTYERKETQSPDDTWQVAKGDEKGYFRFGGSTVILFFEPGSVVFDEDLREYGSRGIEVYARMGEAAGRVKL